MKSIIDSQAEIMQMTTLSDKELANRTAGSRLSCAMGVLGAAAWIGSTFATAGGAAAAGTLAEWGLICGCSTYIDGWFGTHFTGSSFCG